MAWAIEQQEITDPVTRLVLICLSNYTSVDGTNAFPSILRLSRDTGLCERSVQYQLRKLVKLSLIRPGNQAIVAVKLDRKDRRPMSYDVIISRGAPDAPRSSTGCTPRQNGVHLTTERGAPHAPDPEDLIRQLTVRRFSKKTIQKAHESSFRAPHSWETENGYKTQLMLWMAAQA